MSLVGIFTGSLLTLGLSTASAQTKPDLDKGLGHVSASEEFKGLQQERRKALVIGASDYSYAADLPGAAHDAKLMASSLKDVGFSVTLSIDDRGHDIERAIIDFARSVQPGDVALIYWSGHGVQRDGRNWLIPIDADISEPERLVSDAIDVSLILQALSRASSRLNIVILDACRNNPWEKGWRATGKAFAEVRGLAQPEGTPTGFVIAYATDPGRTAADGGTHAGPYAQALAARMKEARELQEVFQSVHADVENETFGQQRPWVTMALGPGSVLVQREPDCGLMDRLEEGSRRGSPGPWSGKIPPASALARSRPPFRARFARLCRAGGREALQSALLPSPRP